MALDVETPDPPELPEAQDPNEYPGVAGVEGEGDFRRGELETLLHDGAWQEGFEEWTEHTDLTETEFATARELGLLRGFDFYWDGGARDVDFYPPEVTDDWRDRDVEGLDSGTVLTIDNAMTDLGRTVAEMLEYYVDWDADEPLDFEQQWGTAEFDDQ